MRTGTIYFLECDGRIKIGFSRNPDDRVKDLATGAPAKLVRLGHVDGPISLETALHRHLRNYRVSGEWFQDCEPVREAIRAAMAGESFEIQEFSYPELISALKRIAAPLTFEPRKLLLPAHQSELGCLAGERSISGTEKRGALM